MRARRTLTLCLGVLIAAALALSAAGGGQAEPAGSAQAAPVSGCTSSFDLTNGSFETPDVGGFEIADQSRVTGWHTTESDGGIEIWQDGYLGVPAAAGEQFAELSANEPGELYQDRATTPGAELSYAVSHRGRSGTDTMEIRIGPPGGPPNFTRIVSSGDTAWHDVFGDYTIPAGQTVTRFGFAAVHNASGNPTIGNFLDNIILTQAQCTLTMRKRLVPAADPGRFDLLADRRPLARAVGNGGAGGPVALPLAEVTVSERAAPGTDLDDYASAIRCTDSDSGELLAQAHGTKTTLRLDRARNVSCVAANTPAPAVVLVKQLEPPGDDGRFELSVDQQTVAAAAGDDTVTGPTRVPVGTVSVAEAAAPGTGGGDYASGIQCRDRAGRGDVVAQALGRRVEFDASRSLVVCLLLNVAQDSPPQPPQPGPTPAPAPPAPVIPPPPSPARSVDLTAHATALTPTVAAGVRARFRVRLRNHGPLTATNVRVVPVVRRTRAVRLAVAAQRAPGLRVKVARRHGICVSGRRAAACALGTLAPGATATLTVTAPTGTRLLTPVRLIVGAVAAEPDRRRADNLDRARVRVRAPARAKPCPVARAHAARRLC